MIALLALLGCPYPSLRDPPTPGPPTPVDRDGDGYPEDVDCDEGDPDVHPDAVEVCGDAVDQDCDGRAPRCLQTGTFVPTGVGSTYIFDEPWFSALGVSLDDGTGGLVVLDFTGIAVYRWTGSALEPELSVPVAGLDESGGFPFLVGAQDLGGDGTLEVAILEPGQHKRCMVVQDVLGTPSLAVLADGLVSCRLVDSVEGAYLIVVTPANGGSGVTFQMYSEVGGDPHFTATLPVDGVLFGTAAVARVDGEAHLVMGLESRGFAITPVVPSGSATLAFGQTTAESWQPDALLPLPTMPAFDLGIGTTPPSGDSPILTSVTTDAGTVVHGRDSAGELRVFEGAPNDGFNLVALGDFDVDGVDDFALSAFGGTGVSVYSGLPSPTSVPLLTVLGSVEQGDFGDRLEPAGDLDGDGVPDLVVSQPTGTPLVIFGGIPE